MSGLIFSSYTQTRCTEETIKAHLPVSSFVLVSHYYSSQSYTYLIVTGIAERTEGDDFCDDTGMLTAQRKYGGRTVCFKFRGRVYRGLILPLHCATSMYDYMRNCVVHVFSYFRDAGTTKIFTEES